MSEDFEYPDSETLRRLTLPQTVTSPQGLEDIKFAKVIILTWTVNEILKSRESIKKSLGPSNPGFSMAIFVPDDERWLVWSITLRAQTTATSGVRLIILTIRDNEGDDVYGVSSQNGLVNLQPPPNTLQVGAIGPFNNWGYSNVHMTYAIEMRSGWHIFVSSAAIDNNDAISVNVQITREKT